MRRLRARFSTADASRRHEGTGEEIKEIDDIAMIFGYRYSAAIVVEEPASGGPVEDPRKPSGRPGLRAPHVWLDKAGTQLSTLDLFTGAFTLLVGRDGADWVTAAEATAVTFGIQLDVQRIGVDLNDPENQWHGTYGITTTGAALVRPDGFVAWRASELSARPERELQQALTRVLALSARHNAPAG